MRTEPGVLVGRQHARVDDQHARLRPAVALELRRRCRWRGASRARPPTSPRTSPGSSTWWRLTPLPSRRCPTSVPRNARPSTAAGSRPCGPRRARRTRDRRPRSTQARSACRSRRARGTARAGSQGTRPSSSRLRAGSCTRAGRDRRRGRSSTPSRRATRCRPPPAAGRRDRRASRRRARHRDARSNTRSSASSQPGVTIVSLLRNTTILAARELGAAVAGADEAAGSASLRSKRTPVTAASAVCDRLGRRVVDDDHLVAARAACARARSSGR